MRLGLEIRVERSKALAGVLLTSEFSPGVAIRVAMATSGQLVSVRGRFKKALTSGMLQMQAFKLSVSKEMMQVRPMGLADVRAGIRTTITVCFTVPFSVWPGAGWLGAG